VYRRHPSTLLRFMDVEITTGPTGPAPAEPAREYAQWLTCTACAVAWVGMWSGDPCWCCGSRDHVRLRWVAAA
jgi:hypothetical protein